MQVLKKEFELQRRFYLPKLSSSIFIHPTDSHYSIGCDATNSLLVTKLRLLKKWHTQPFSVIAPSKKWITDNLDVPQDALNHLPGPIIIIARMKNPDCVCEDVHLGTFVLGVRMPNHWISGVVSELGVPIVSSCANKYAETLMTSIENADKQLLEASDMILHEGAKHGKPLVFIDYTEGTKVIE